MKRTVYKTDIEGLANYVADISNLYNFDIKIPGIIDRFKISDNTHYQHTLMHVGSCTIEPSFNVIIDNKDMRVSIYLSEVPFSFKLKYVDCNMDCTINYNIPRVRLSVDISFSTVNEYLNDFVKFENKLEKLIEMYYTNILKDILSGKISNIKSEWILKSDDFSCALTTDDRIIYDESIFCNIDNDNC